MAFEGSFKITYALLNLNYKLTIDFNDGHRIKVLNRPLIKIQGILSSKREVCMNGFQ